MTGIHVLGIIAPHPPIMLEAVGGADAARTDASARAMAEAAEVLSRFAPDTVVIMSPHSPAFSNGFVVDTSARYQGNLEQFGAPRTRLEFAGDEKFAGSLLAALRAAEIPAFDRAESARLVSGVLDHGVVVPMSYLDPDGRWPLVSLSLSGLDMNAHRSLGRVLGETARALGRKIAFVASGDLSHRLSPDAPAGYEPTAEGFDALLVDIVGRADLDALASIDPALADVAGECGLRSFVTLSGLISDPRTRVLAYEAPWGVGYLTALVADDTTFTELDLATPVTGVKHGSPGEDTHEIVVLARDAIEAFVRAEEVIPPRPLHDPGLPPRAGVFVSLHIGDALRGCIGTIVPTLGSLAEEVVNNAIQAATEDSRFSPLSAEELHELDVKVDVLGPPERCEPADLDPARYGVIVSAGGRRGLLLPDLEGVDTVAQQLDIARRKAGISPTEPVEYSRFSVDRYA